MLDEETLIMNGILKTQEVSSLVKKVGNYELIDKMLKFSYTFETTMIDFNTIC